MKNPKIRYYLESKSKDVSKRINKELVMAEIGYAYRTLDKKGNTRIKPFRFSLQASILPKNFGKAEFNFKLDDEVFKKYSKTDSTIKNKMLQLENAVNELNNHYTHNLLVPSPSEFKNELNIKLSRTKRDVKVDMAILDYLNKRIIDLKADLGINKRDRIKLNSIKIYVSLGHLIENYQLATNETLQFRDFDKEKYWHLWDVSDDILKDIIKVVNPNQHKKQQKQSYGYLSVTIRKYQKSLIKTLREAANDGLSVPLNINDTKLILENSEASKSFYIEESLLKKVIKANLESDKELQLAKEYLIIACLMGMRYESVYDTQNAKIEAYRKDKYNFDYIVSIQNKTSTKVCIPLLEPVKQILNKYGAFPTFKSNPKMNVALKKLFVFLKIDRLEEVTRVTYKSGTIKTKEPISKLITTHDCKGSFYSNLYEAGVSKTVIDSITHPDKADKNPMAKYYNKADMIVTAKFFVDEIKKIKSDVYTF